MLAGRDPLHLPVDRFLNLVYYWLVKDAQEQEEINKFERRLWMPPKGVAPAPGSPWSPESETAAFKAFTAEVAAAPKPKAS